MRRWSSRVYAFTGIVAQFLALARILSEPFRLKYFAPHTYTLASIEPFIAAALFTAVLAAISVAMFALGRVRAALTIAVLNVVTLFAYKLVFM